MFCSTAVFPAWRNASDLLITDTAILAVTPWRDVVADKSPFVELFMLAGLPAAAGIINFVVLTSAASSANSGVFSTSRMLFGLAMDGDAPSKFKNLSRRAVPSNGQGRGADCGNKRGGCHADHRGHVDHQHHFQRDVGQGLRL